MTPAQETAKELIERFTIRDSAGFQQVSNMYIKQCALICVGKMIEENGNLYLLGVATDYYRNRNTELFEIKQAIENYGNN